VRDLQSSQRPPSTQTRPGGKKKRRRISTKGEKTCRGRKEAYFPGRDRKIRGWDFTKRRLEGWSKKKAFFFQDSPEQLGRASFSVGLEGRKSSIFLKSLSFGEGQGLSPQSEKRSPPERITGEVLN